MITSNISCLCSCKFPVFAFQKRYSPVHCLSRRALEDLDFNGTINVGEIKGLWVALLEDLSRFGINAEIRNEWLAEVGYSFDVSYQGPLYDGRNCTNPNNSGAGGKVHVDISLRHEQVDTGRELVRSE